MGLDDTYAYFTKKIYFTSYNIQIGGIIQTYRTDETLMLKGIKF